MYRIFKMEFIIFHRYFNSGEKNQSIEIDYKETALNSKSEINNENKIPLTFVNVQSTCRVKWLIWEMTQPAFGNIKSECRYGNDFLLASNQRSVITGTFLFIVCFNSE